MPSELDDLVLSQAPANKPRGLTFDDVPMPWNGPSEILLRHGGFRPLVERLASVEPTAAAMRRYDPTWDDDLAALLTSDPRLASMRVKPGSIPRSSAAGPWNLFVGPDNPHRPSYMIEPTLGNNWQAAFRARACRRRPVVMKTASCATGIRVSLYRL